MKQAEKITDKVASPESRDKFIVGVGASAGGLDAIYNLFSFPVPHQASFIIIQHLPPEYKSTTAELLSKHTGEVVTEVKNNMRVESGKIYVMCERKSLTIQNGVMLLKDAGPSQFNNPIDLFFSSLAKDQGDRSIGIVLSGSNDDGTSGAGAIKEAGGFVIAQDPGTTSFGNMPYSVINSGNANVALPPELMMEEINNHMQQTLMIGQFTENNEAALEEIINLIKNHSPLDFSQYKRATLIRRIIKRMTSKNFDELPEYIDFLKSNTQEIDALSKEFLISVTKFFRDAEVFEILKEKVLPVILQNKSPDAPLKVWTVGCATGEEAYSLAIVIDELCKSGKISTDVKIFATDIDKDALAIASKGVYPQSIRKDLSSERLSNYFIQENDGYRIKDELRQMIIFAQHDITKHPPYHKLDLISCRNLLIYLNNTLQKRVLSTLHFCLKQDGYLLLGPSESIGSLEGNLKELSKQWKIYQNIKPAKKLQYLTYTPPLFFKQDNKPLPEVTPPKKKPQSHLDEAIGLALLSELNYDGVCVDENFKIVKTLGDYKKFLLPEMFNFNLLELLPWELAMTASTSLKKAGRQKKGVLVEHVRFLEGKKNRSVDILVKGLPQDILSEKFFLVAFKEHKIRKGEATEKVKFEKEAFTKRYLTEIEEELKETRQKLLEAEDALVVSTSHAQAYSEELISNNEELQSINEELHTVNNDNDQKMKELIEINDELNNYFRSTTNSQLYVDRDLIIRKFSPLAFKQINLKESDIGRPLTDIHSNIKFSPLLDAIKDTIVTSNESDREVQTLDGKWYQMRLTPFIRKENNKTDGVVITFGDITKLKQTEETLNKIIQDHDTFIYSVSHDLRNELGNILMSSEELYRNLKEMDAEDINKFSGYVYTSARRLLDVITDLTDISNIEKEIGEGKYKEIDIHHLLSNINLSISELLEQSNAIIKTDFKVPAIPFMKKNLRSILLNLLTNAIKCRSPDRRLEVTIRTEEQDKYVLLSIEDNGIGIRKDKLEGIFSKFKRVHGTSTKNIEGTGIGMYLVHKIITNAGGKIEVSSTVGKGTTFTVWFLKNPGPEHDSA